MATKSPVTSTQFLQLSIVHACNSPWKWLPGRGFNRASRLNMTGDRIEFISAYCDRWCERCPYTARCSLYAVEVATTMCGDFREGLELAVGKPRQVGRDDATPEWREELLEGANAEASEDEIAEDARREAERHARIAVTPLMELAWTLTMLSHRWLSVRSQEIRALADVVLVEALDTVAHDAAFVGAKLSRALHGRDRRDDEKELDDEPIQNDWNGSAKVALISLERSEAAWRVIAQSSADDTPAMLAEHTRDLRGEVERLFPEAWKFVRPGFDAPG